LTIAFAKRIAVLFAGACFAFFLVGVVASHGATGAYTATFADFKTIHVFPAGRGAKAVALYVADDSVWTVRDEKLARTLAERGILVGGIGSASYLEMSQKSKQACLYPAGDLENLSKYIQQRERIGDFITPVIIGKGLGAAIVFAAVSQSPPNTFLGALSVDFSPSIACSKPFCRGTGLVQKRFSTDSLLLLPRQSDEIPWDLLHSTQSTESTARALAPYVSGTEKTAIHFSQETAAGLAPESTWITDCTDAVLSIINDTAAHAGSADLSFESIPLREFRPDSGTMQEPLVVYFTGDGGWDVSDRGIGRSLARQGRGMVGVNSLKYFWKEHSPDSVAADVKRLIAHFLKAWRLNEVVLVGYSFGADILPFVATRVMADFPRTVKRVVLISPAAKADFSFHLGSWFGKTGKKSLDVLPEAEKITSVPLICFYGSRDSESIGPRLSGHAKVIPLKSGHRVGNSYEPIVSEIIGGQ
jgi:type IV secretory pathway VirJ component